VLALAQSAGALPVDAQATDPDFIIARLLQMAAATRAENGDCYCRGCSHDCQAGGGPACRLGTHIRLKRSLYRIWLQPAPGHAPRLAPSISMMQTAFTGRSGSLHGRIRGVLTEFDAWLGKTLFLPPIIKMCQITRQSQFAVSRLFWFVAALDGFWRADTLFSSILFGALSVVMMLTASLRADLPTRSSLLMRMLGVLLLALDLAAGAITGRWAGAEFWFIVLVAEYAATIRTIPPRETRSSDVATRAVRRG
jgi:hypothetical protein